MSWHRQGSESAGRDETVRESVQGVIVGCVFNELVHVLKYTTSWV